MLLGTNCISVGFYQQRFLESKWFTISIIFGLVRLTNAFFNWVKYKCNSFLDPPTAGQTSRGSLVCIWLSVQEKPLFERVTLDSDQNKERTTKKRRLFNAPEYCKIRDWHTYLHRLASSRSIFRSFDSVLIGYPR